MVITVSMAFPRAKRTDPPDYIDVTFWGQSADFIDKYVNKGDELIITGKMEYQKWNNKEGQVRSKHLINYATINGFTRAKANMAEYGEGGTTFTEAFTDDYDDSEIPF